MDCKEIQPVHPKGDQSWVFIGRTDVEAETPIIWPNMKYQLTGKYPDAGKGWRMEKGMTEDETVGWHHQLEGHEFEQALVVGDGQGSLVWCSSWCLRIGHDWATELIFWGNYILTALNDFSVVQGTFFLKGTSNLEIYGKLSQYIVIFNIIHSFKPIEIIIISQKQ